MNLTEARAFTAQKLKEGHTSDACTRAGDYNFADCCIMHVHVPDL